jgi:hypothetical protein
MILAWRAKLTRHPLRKYIISVIYTYPGQLPPHAHKYPFPRVAPPESCGSENGGGAVVLSRQENQVVIDRMCCSTPNRMQNQ